MNFFTLSHPLFGGGGGGGTGGRAIILFSLSKVYKVGNTYPVFPSVLYHKKVKKSTF
jgi:hypothetical protein